MHTLTLKLETNDAQEHELDKRFRVMCHIHNVLVKRSIKLLGRLSHDTSYQALKTNYLHSGKEEKKALSAQMKSFRESIGLSEYVFSPISRYAEENTKSWFLPVRYRKKRPVYGRE